MQAGRQRLHDARLCLTKRWRRRACRARGFAGACRAAGHHRLMVRDVRARVLMYGMESARRRRPRSAPGPCHDPAGRDRRSAGEGAGGHGELDNAALPRHCRHARGDEALPLPLPAPALSRHQGVPDRYAAHPPPPLLEVFLVFLSRFGSGASSSPARTSSAVPVSEQGLPPSRTASMPGPCLRRTARTRHPGCCRRISSAARTASAQPPCHPPTVPLPWHWPG